MKFFNKVTTIILIIGILFSNFVPLINILAATVPISNCTQSDYKVANETTDLACYNTYNEALNHMNNYPSKIGDVARIVHNNRIINAKYAIVKLDTKGSASINTTITGTENGDGYLNGYYGTDAVLLDYDPTNKKMKIKISGVVGYISLNDGIVEPLTTEVTGLDSNKNYFKIIVSDLRMRDSVGTSGKVIIDEIPIYSLVEVIDSKPILKDGYQWYKVKYKNTTGYIGTDPNEPYIETVSNNLKLETYYYKENGKLYHKILYNSYGRRSIPLYLGKAPLYLKENTRYYSFDGIYFYINIIDMITDYKTGTNTKAVNKTPYYNYYLYLPYRSYSNATAADLNTYINTRYSAKINRFAYYEYNLDKLPDAPGIEECASIANVIEKRGCEGEKRLATGRAGTWVDVTKGINFENGVSMLHGEGANFVNSQELYGANSMLTFSIAINESAFGRSAISVTKYNLFGHSAYDHDAFGSAGNYNSIKAGITYHADNFISDGFAHPLDSRHYGSHLGNKGSGINLKYASDPYWGEKAVQYYAQIIDETGINDFKKDTIGIKISNDSVNVRQTPNTSSKSLYLLKSTSNLPVVILDEVEGEVLNGNNIWYKIQTDPSLDVNGNYVNKSAPYPNSGLYNKDYSVGYVHSSLIYVESEKPIITANNVSIYKNSSFKPLNHASAYDPWDGDLTNKITSTGNVDTLKVGTYVVTYSVTDSDNNTTTKNINVNVVDNKDPLIQGTKDIEIFVGQTLDLKKGITATDPEEGDLTGKIKINPATINTSTPGVYSVTYSVSDSSGKTISKTIKVTINGEYKKVNGSFGLESLKYNNQNQRIDIKGYLTILNIDNNLNNIFTYDIILKNLNNSEQHVLSLDRWTSDREFPFQIPNSDGKNYKYSWFKGSLDLSNVPQGDYLVYVRARGNGYETTALLRDIFFKEKSNKLDKKIVINNRGYLFRRNFLDRKIPLELYIRDENLISTKEVPTIDNMFNSFYKLNLSDKFLNIRGTSYNVGGNYSTNVNVTRKIILEHQGTFKRTTYDVGYIDKGDYKVTLNVSDNLDKTRAWFDANLDVSLLEEGTYVIYIHTKTGTIDDHGILNDLSFRNLGTKITINNKEISLQRNNNKQMRIELVVKTITDK
ncbi:MAG: DUF5011 domain-containing protein [Bacilli bacterium]|nr:DUF5011 domain-containing protein [Bacilli bacterium]